MMNGMGAIGGMARKLPETLCLKNSFSCLQVCFSMLLSGEKRCLLYAAGKCRRGAALLRMQNAGRARQDRSHTPAKTRRLL